MKKKIILFLFILLFVNIVGCANCDMMVEYKVNAKMKIQDYADTKTPNDNSEEISLLLCTIVVNSKQTVDEATSKSSIDAIVEKTKNKIDEVEKIVTQIKQSYLDNFRKSSRLNATIDDVIITEYLGIYSDNFVLVLNDKQNLLFTEIVFSYEVAGFDFSFSKGYPILVFKSGTFSFLHEAYAKGEISKSDLKTIHYLYNNKAFK